MLGSLADADDVLQEAYLRWARDERRAGAVTAAYLFSIVTRLCIDQRQSIEARKHDLCRSLASRACRRVRRV